MFKPKVTWTDTEITVNVGDEIQRKIKAAKFSLYGGICTLCVFGLGLIPIILGVMDMRRDDEGHFYQMKRQWTNIAKNKNMTIKFVNFPESLAHYRDKDFSSEAS